MAYEIERKFLVSGNGYKDKPKSMTRYRQGYLPTTGEATARIRIAGENGFVTIKGPTKGLSRLEFEYPIPVEDAERMLSELCSQPLIEKIRYTVDVEGTEWTVDEFFGDNTGLVVAEVELDSEDADFSQPDWLGKEVSDDPRYRNSNLQKKPFKTW